MYKFRGQEREHEDPDRDKDEDYFPNLTKVGSRTLTAGLENRSDAARVEANPSDGWLAAQPIGAARATISAADATSRSGDGAWLAAQPIGAAVRATIAPSPADASTSRFGDLTRLRATLEKLAGSGVRLPETAASKYSALLGADLSSVRIHATGEASEVTAAMGARALTHGAHIAFAPGAYDEAIADRDHVLAHELVHVVQNQRSGGPAMQLAARLDVGPSGSAVESEAEAGAHALTSGRAFAVASRSSLPGISLFDGPGPAPTATPPANATPPPAAGAPPATATPVTAPPPAAGAPPATATPAPAGTTAPPANGAPPATATPTATGAPPTTGAPPATATPAPAGDKPGAATPAPVAPGAALDSKIAAILEQRADPAAKSSYTATLGSIMTLRLTATQYSFVNSNIGHTLLQMVWPSDALGDHLGQIGKLNAYRGNDPGGGTSFWGGVQRGIEGLRGILHMLGDLAAALSAIAGVVAIAAAAVGAVCAISVIGLAGPAEVAAGIAVIADAIATAAALVKIAADLIDMLLGILQMVILVFRARAAKGDPAQRARFAQLLHKEAGDFAGNFVGVVVQIGVLVATAGAGAGGAKGLSKMAAKDVGHEFEKLLPKEALKSLKSDLPAGLKIIKRGLADTKAGAKLGAKAGVRAAALGADEEVAKLSVLLRTAKGKAIKVKGGGKARELVEFTLDKQRRGALTILNTGKVNYVGIKNVGAIAAAAQTTQFIVDTKAPTGPGGPGGDGPKMRAPGTPIAGSLATVQMWPSQIEAFKTEKNLLGNVKEHCEEQYENAKTQAGPELAAAFEEKLKAAIDKRNAAKEEAAAVKGDAADSKAQSDKGATTAAQGADTKKKADANNAALKNKTDTAGGKAETLKTPPAKDGIGSWIYNHSIGYLGRAIGWVQDGIKNNLGKFLFYLAGYDSTELDMAGIEGDMRTSKQNDTHAGDAAAQVETAVDPVQKAVVDMQADKTTSQQQAIQGMADSKNFVEALEEADKTLGEAIETGEAYMAAAAPLLAHELDTESAGKPIDGAYVQPLLAYADAVASSIDAENDAPAIAAQANAKFAALAADLPGIDIGPAQTVIAKAAADYATGHAALVANGHAAAAKVKAAISAFVGTSDFNGCNQNALALDHLADEMMAASDALGDAMVATINNLIDQYNQAIAAAMAGAAQQPGPVQAPDSPDANPTTTGPQRKATGEAADGVDPVAVGARGIAGGGGSLPHLDVIQQSFGRHDVSGVQAHQGGAAAEAANTLGARAYAMGNAVAFAGAPDLHTAAHEAAHVIQQRSGVQLAGGIDGGASDPHERHADAVADAVVAGKSAEALLGSGGSASGSSVQRAPGDPGDKAPRISEAMAARMRVDLDAIVTALEQPKLDLGAQKALVERLGYYLHTDDANPKHPGKHYVLNRFLDLLGTKQYVPHGAKESHWVLDDLPTRLTGSAKLRFDQIITAAGDGPAARAALAHRSTKGTSSATIEAESVGKTPDQQDGIIQDQAERDLPGDLYKRTRGMSDDEKQDAVEDYEMQDYLRAHFPPGFAKWLWQLLEEIPRGPLRWRVVGAILAEKGKQDTLEGIEITKGAEKYKRERDAKDQEHPQEPVEVTRAKVEAAASESAKRKHKQSASKTSPAAVVAKVTAAMRAAKKKPSPTANDSPAKVMTPATANMSARDGTSVDSNNPAASAGGSHLGGGHLLGDFTPAPANGMGTPQSPPPPQQGGAGTLAINSVATAGASAGGAGADRNVVGVGEEVTFSGAGGESGTWSADGGTPATANGDKFVWSAPGTAGNFTIKLTVGDKVATKAISSILPTSVKFTKTGDWGPDEDWMMGAGMDLDMELQPLTVSFTKITIREQPGGASNVSGYFSSGKGDISHHPSAGPTLIRNNNKTGSFDEAHLADATGDLWPRPLSVGSMTWQIPYLWSGAGVTDQSFSIVNQTMGIVDSKGTVTVSKSDQSTSRSPKGKPPPGAIPKAGGAGGRHGGQHTAIARDATTSSSTPSHVPEVVSSALASAQGVPLQNPDLWSERVGADVSHARVVTGEGAAEAAAAIDARAFTVGDRVFMGAGHDASTDGGGLLSHELTHVAQQAGAPTPSSWDSLSVLDHGDHREVAARANDAGQARSEQAIARDPTPAPAAPDKPEKGDHEGAQIGKWDDTTKISTTKTIGLYTTEAEAMAAANTMGAVILENGRYVAYHITTNAWFDRFIYENCKVLVSSTYTNVWIDAPWLAVTTQDGVVLRPSMFGTDAAKNQMTPDLMLKPGESPFGGFPELIGTGKQVTDEKLIEAFTAAMKKGAVGVLANSEKEVQAKRDQFQSSKGTGPDEFKLIRTTATRLAKLDDEIATAASEAMGPLSAAGADHEKPEAILKRVEADRRKTALEQERKVALNDYPMLARQNPKDIQNASDSEIAKRLGDDSMQILQDITKTRDNLLTGSLDLWGVPSMVDTTIAGCGIADADRRGKIEAHAKAIAKTEAIEKGVLTVFAIGLGLLATFSTGGLALVASAGALGLSTYDALNTTKNFAVDSAAANTNVNPELALAAKEVGSYGWVLLAWVGVGLDLGTVASALKGVKSIGEVAQAASQLARGSEALLTKLRLAAGIVKEGEVVSELTRGVLALKLGARMEIRAGLGTEVRVMVDVDSVTGRVTARSVLVGEKALVKDILAHTETVSLLNRYEGITGQLRELMDRMLSIVGKEVEKNAGNPFPPGTQAFESFLECKKLPKIIDDRIRTLEKGAGFLTKDAEEPLRNEIKFLQDDLARHKANVDNLALEKGSGFIAKSEEVTKEAVEVHHMPFPGDAQGVSAADKQWYYYRRDGAGYELCTRQDAPAGIKRFTVQNGTLVEGTPGAVQKGKLLVAGWPKEQQTAFEALQALEGSDAVHRVVPLQGVKKLEKTIGEAFTAEQRAQLIDIYKDAWLAKDATLGEAAARANAKATVDKLMGHDITLVQGTDQLRLFDYAKTYPGKPIGELHHDIPLYLGGDHTMLTDIGKLKKADGTVRDLHDEAHAIFDQAKFADGGTLAPSDLAKRIPTSPGAAVLKTNGDIDFYVVSGSGDGTKFVLVQ